MLNISETVQEIQIRSPHHFQLRLDALAEVCALWAQSSLFIF